MNILRYENYETLKVCQADDKYQVETDANFIADVEKIAKVRRNVVLNILEFKK